MIKLFDMWDLTGVSVNDPGIRKYINLKPIILPRVFGRPQSKRFGKSEVNIVERLVNKLGVSGHRGKKHKFTSGRNIGKSQMAMNAVIKSFQIIEKKTNKNPVQVLVNAIENTSPRGEITVIEYGGTRHPKSVDVSPQRRVDLSLRWLSQGAAQRTIKKKRTLSQALAQEIMDAASGNKCFSFSKKTDMERQAAASR